MWFTCFRFWPDGTLLLGAQVAPVDVPVLRFGVNDPRLHVVDCRIKTVAAVNHLPVFIHDAVARQRLARPAPTAVVLQAAADVVGFLVVEPHFVELSDRDGVDEVPGLPRVVAPVNPAIRSRKHVIRIRRIDPHRMVVSVDAPDALRRKSFSSILGVKHRRAQRPDAQVIVRIDPHLAVVRRPRIRIAHLFPRFAFVLAAVNAALFMLYQRIDDVRIPAVNIQSDAAGFSAVLVRQPFGQFFPGRAAIRRLVDRAIRSAAVKSIGRPPSLIRRGI